MNTIKCAMLGLALAAGLSACEIFEDPTAEMVSVRMEGPVGTQVLGIYSKVFQTGQDEVGVVQVDVDRADTVIQTLPIDTIIDIRIERQIFVQIESMDGDTLSVSVRVDIDDEVDLERTGFLFPEAPFRYLFQFNRPRVNTVEPVL